MQEVWVGEVGEVGTLGNCWRGRSHARSSCPRARTTSGTLHKPAPCLESREGRLKEAGWYDLVDLAEIMQDQPPRMLDQGFVTVFTL